MLLEAIYEPVFLGSSHGFRPGLGPHTALKGVRESFIRSTWIIEGDISKYFDTVNHETLLQILAERISDPKLMRLIRAGLKAGVLLPNGVLIKESEVGTPQGGIASPILSNIYLHKLDVWMAEKKESYDIGAKRRPNKEYGRKQKQGKTAAQIRAMGLRYTDAMDPKFRRLHYVRYADDFLVGVEGPRAEAEQIRTEIETELKRALQLKLNMEKTVIRH